MQMAAEATAGDDDVAALLKLAVGEGKIMWLFMLLPPFTLIPVYLELHLYPSS